MILPVIAKRRLATSRGPALATRREQRRRASSAVAARAPSAAPCASTVQIGPPAGMTDPGGERSAAQSGQAKPAGTRVARSAMDDQRARAAASASIGLGQRAAATGARHAGRTDSTPSARAIGIERAARARVELEHGDGVASDQRVDAGQAAQAVVLGQAHGRRAPALGGRPARCPPARARRRTGTGGPGRGATSCSPMASTRASRPLPTTSAETGSPAGPALPVPAASPWRPRPGPADMAAAGAAGALAQPARTVGRAA